MNLLNELINKCETTFSYNQEIKDKIIYLLNSNKLNQARILIDDEESDLIDNILVRIEDEGEIYIHNAKIDTLNNIRDIYAIVEYMLLSLESEDQLKQLNINNNNNANNY
jgi:hypothetical protein